MLKHNHLASIFAAAVAAVSLLFTACVPENVGPEADLPKGAIILNAPDYKPMNNSKLGVDNEGKDVFFAQGDVLWVNGVACTVSVTGNTAYIDLPTTVNYPLRFVYPYNIVDPSFTYDNTDNVPIILPSAYTYTTVQSGPGKGRQNVPAPLCAKITSPSENITEAFFKHISAAITVAIQNKTGAPMRLEKIAIESQSTMRPLNLDNHLSINVSNPSIDYAATGSRSNSMTFSDPLNIENGEVAYVQVPIRNYLDLKLKIGVLAQNTLPNVIANKFYFQNQQKTNFNIGIGELAYAPAKFDIDMDPNDPDYGLLVDGTFTISGTNNEGKPRKVYFAKGNLTYNVGTTLPPTYSDNNWAFADDQYIRHESTPTISDQTRRYNKHSSDNLITLFLYGANGHDLDNAYTNHPQYGPCEIALGSSYTRCSYNLTRENGADWGVRMGEKWFTLTKSDWEALMSGCQKSYGKYGDVAGMLVYPNKYGNIGSANTLMGDANLFTVIHTDQASISDNGWATLQNTGVLFLPSAGYLRAGFAGNQTTATIARSQLTGHNTYGSYWTSTWNDETDAAVGFLFQATTSGTISTTTYTESKNINAWLGWSNVTTSKNIRSLAVRLAYPANF